MFSVTPKLYNTMYIQRHTLNASQKPSVSQVGHWKHFCFIVLKILKWFSLILAIGVSFLFYLLTLVGALLFLFVLLFKLTLLIYNLHEIKCTHFKCTMSFNKCTLTCETTIHFILPMATYKLWSLFLESWFVNIFKK